MWQFTLKIKEHQIPPYCQKKCISQSWEDLLLFMISFFN